MKLTPTYVGVFGGKEINLTCYNRFMSTKYIKVDPKVGFGKPVIAGTRVPVEVVVGKIAGGMEIEEVMREYSLTKNQVRAALRYAADVVTHEKVMYA